MWLAELVVEWKLWKERVDRYDFDFCVISGRKHERKDHIYLHLISQSLIPFS